MRHDASGPIVIWEDYGYEGWQPKSFDTLKEALLEPRYSASFVLTRLVDVAVDEQRAQRPENLGNCPIDGKECDCIMPCRIDGQSTDRGDQNDVL